MDTIDQAAIARRHEAAAAMWGLGGRHYDDVSFAIADALSHTAQRLNAKPGERILDVATGTGWSARNVARTGAMVTGIDISRDLLAAARELSAHVRPPIEFRLADAEQLPFEDGAFDGIISTFGVMFAVDQTQAAAELARVCRHGGRIALATWVPGGAVAQFFALIGQHSGEPPPAASPLAWGDPAEVEKLLGGAFDLTFERGMNHAYHANAQDIWDWYVRGFGPLRQLADSLPPERLKLLKRDVDVYHEHYAAPAGLNVEREYLVIVGRRR